MEYSKIKTERFIDSILQHNLPASAHHLLLVLFKETILKDHKDTGFISKDDLCKMTGIPKGTLGEAIRKLENTGLLVSSHAGRNGTARCLHIPGHGPLYDLPKISSLKKPRRRINLKTP